MTLVILGLIIATLLVVLYLSMQLSAVKRRLAAVPADRDVFSLLGDLKAQSDRSAVTLADLVPRVDRLEEKLPYAVSRTGVVSYDAFGNIAGNLSRSIALLDEQGSGVVISLLVGRDETRFYTKQVEQMTGLEPLSPEEMEAIAAAMHR